MTNHFISAASDLVAFEKNDIRILIVDDWSFQLMETVSKLSEAGYFNTYPALGCMEGLIALHNAQKTYDILLCSTSLNFAELSILLQAASRNHLTRYYSLIGDAGPLDSHLEFFQNLNTHTFRFLGVFDKPLLPYSFGRALAHVHIHKNQRIAAPSPEIRGGNAGPS